MAIYATEITSDQDPSDAPVHQRLLKAFVIASHMVEGDLLEVGCGEGRGYGGASSHEGLKGSASF